MPPRPPPLGGGGDGARRGSRSCDVPVDVAGGVGAGGVRGSGGGPACHGGTGADVVAVGVETTDQLARLRAVGVTYAQGYVLSRPQSATQIGTNIRRNDPAGWTFTER
jgi:hypothetical protein